MKLKPNSKQAIIVQKTRSRIGSKALSKLMEFHIEKFQNAGTNLLKAYKNLDYKDKIMIHSDKNIGISGENISWMRSKDGKMFWCKKPIALFGSFNMSNEELRTISPFSPEFNDCFVEGKGSTKEEALENMAKEEKELADGLWSME